VRYAPKDSPLHAVQVIKPDDPRGVANYAARRCRFGGTMRIRSMIGGVTALASIAGAAVAFLWQGINWLQSSAWPKLSVATALRWLDARSWARLAHTWPEAYTLLDSIPLSLALVGLAFLGWVLATWGSD
jgi:hypothetical protein